MNDTIKEQNGKNSKRNNVVCITFKVKRELEFGKFYTQSCLVILLPKYFISFLSKQKHAHNF